MRIPLESLDRSEQEKIKKIGGRYIVVIDEEPCLTCVLPKTELLSLKYGYREIEKIQESTSVISHLGRATKIQRRMELNYSGKIIEITGVGMRPVSFTEDHEILVKEGRRGRKVWKKIDKVTRNDYLIVPKIVVNGVSHFTMIDPEFIGIFVADGFVDLLENQCRSVVIRQNDYKAIKKLIEKNGFGAHVYKNSGSYLIEIHDVKLAKWLRYHFYNDEKNKVLPTWFLRLPKEEIIKFIKGYLYGDGYIDKQGTIGVSSKSKRLIDQVSILLLRLGVFPKLSYEEEEKEYNGYAWKSKIFKIRLSVKHSQILARILDISYPNRKLSRKWQIRDTKRYFYVPIEKLETRNYTGIVKNLTTKSGTYSLPFIVHNCGHKTRLLHLERTDGKQEIVRECLYCLTNHCHTAANRSAP